MKKNTGADSSLTFSNGTATIPRAPGYWRVDVDTLRNNTLTYTDTLHEQMATGVTTEYREKTITGIPFFVFYVSDTVGKYEFLPDYNARYSVLAGDSYMSEAADILYDTAP